MSTNTSTTSTNDIIDALVYSGIKNNITKTNFPAYSDLLDKMDISFGSDVTAALSIGDKHKRGAAVGGDLSALHTARE
jgi:hypothetical protein